MNKKEKREEKMMSKKGKNPGNGFKAKEAAAKPIREMEDSKRRG